MLHRLLLVHLLCGHPLRNRLRRQDQQAFLGSGAPARVLRHVHFAAGPFNTRSRVQVLGLVRID